MLWLNLCLFSFYCQKIDSSISHAWKDCCNSWYRTGYWHLIKFWCISTVFQSKDCGTDGQSEQGGQRSFLSSPLPSCQAVVLWSQLTATLREQVTCQWCMNKTEKVTQDVTTHGLRVDTVKLNYHCFQNDPLSDHQRYCGACFTSACSTKMHDAHYKHEDDK